MKTNLLLVCLVAGSMLWEATKGTPAITFRQLGQFHAKSPSFISVQIEPPEADAVDAVDAGPIGNWSLLVSSFSGNPFAKDGVYISRNIQEPLASSSISQVSLMQISNEVVWPNEFRLAPEAAFHDVAWCATGFLVPGKTKGTISLFNMSTNPISGPHVITSTSSNWFYHRIIWDDVNGDHLLDAITARADKPLIGNTKSELLWLEQPQSDPLNTPWQEHSLIDGPDVFFIMVELPVAGKLMKFAICAEYFSKKLTLVWPQNDTAWSATPMMSRTIDEVDAPFDLKPVDANGDGKLEIVVTINNEHNGSVIIYEVPDDFQNPDVAWPKHIISTGYSALKPTVGRGSPGSIFPVCAPPTVKRNGSCYHSSTGVVPPSFILSGDDGGHVYSLVPSVQDGVRFDWTYNQTMILEVDGTVGQLAVAEILGDSHLQVFVPDYNGNLIHVLST